MISDPCPGCAGDLAGLVDAVCRDCEAGLAEAFAHVARAEGAAAERAAIVARLLQMRDRGNGALTGSEQNLLTFLAVRFERGDHHKHEPRPVEGAKEGEGHGD